MSVCKQFQNSHCPPVTDTFDALLFIVGGCISSSYAPPFCKANNYDHTRSFLGKIAHNNPDKIRVSFPFKLYVRVFKRNLGMTRGSFSTVACILQQPMD